MTDPIAGIPSVAALAPATAQAVIAPRPSSAAAPPAAPPPPADLQRIAAALGQAYQPRQTDLRFQVDHVTGQMVISVVDAQDGKTLLQIPGEEALAIAQSLEQMDAHLIQRNA